MRIPAAGRLWLPPERYMEPVTVDLVPQENVHQRAELVDLAYASSVNRLTEQRARLEGIRTRAAALLTVASLVVTFATDAGLFGTKGGGPGLDLGYLVALMLIFLLVGICAVCVLQPTPPSWQHGPPAVALLDDFPAHLSDTAVKAAAAEFMTEAADTYNATHLDFCSWWYRRGSLLLGVELLVLVAGSAF
ncbi:hypothetical protein C0216_07070 [Streptomyces globosus]|uniref:Integral membrane plasmid transfer protein n=1 Tax=Streptomyces globosus TaxID=68209 RepID=A0A344TX76_9ACTN|nr:hypothetical protein [Streptomyces globosus]AXE23247.1 hypothetical protein C0216_07070 [Streptomyces globosus]